MTPNSHMTQGVGSKGSGSFSIGPALKTGTSSIDLAQGGIGSRDSLHQQHQQIGQHHRRKSSDGLSSGVRGVDLSGKGKRSSSGMRSMDLDISGRSLRGIDRSGRGIISGDDRVRSPLGDNQAASPGVEGNNGNEEEEDGPGLDISGRGLLKGVSRRETVAVAREKQEEQKRQGQSIPMGETEKQHVVDSKKGEDGTVKKTGMGKRVGSAPSGLQVTRSEVLDV